MDLMLPGVMTSTSYAPDEMDWSEFERAASKFKAVDLGIQWWIGDLGVYGERKFPERFSHAWLAEKVGRPRASVRAYIWVCGRIPARRRRSDLDFSHHRVAAKLEPPECDAMLARAAKEGWTVTQLREEIRGPVTRVTKKFAISLTAEQAQEIGRLLASVANGKMRGKGRLLCADYAKLLGVDPLGPPLPPTPPSPPISPKEPKREPFVPPDPERCAEYGAEIGLPPDQVEQFLDHFRSNGWKVGGRSEMVDWQAAMRFWKRKWARQARPARSVQSLSQRMLKEAGFGVD